MLPTYLVIGAKKAGTSAVHRCLDAHPDVGLPPRKRVDFFSGLHWDRGVEWYSDQFPVARASGEVCNSYSHDPLVAGVPARVASVIPEVRIVYVLRHPVERLLSHHRNAVANWGAPLDLSAAVAADPKEFLPPSRYGHQLGRWLEHFPLSQILVVRSEDLGAGDGPAMKAIFEHIGVDPHLAGAVASAVNASTDLRREQPWLSRFRHSGLYGRVRHLVPVGLRSRVWRSMSAPVPAELVPDPIDDETRSAIEALLRPDLELLTGLLPGFDCWGLLDTHPR